MLSKIAKLRRFSRVFLRPIFKILAFSLMFCVFLLFSVYFHTILQSLSKAGVHVQPIARAGADPIARTKMYRAGAGLLPGR